MTIACIKAMYAHACSEKAHKLVRKIMFAAFQRDWPTDDLGTTIDGLLGAASQPEIKRETYDTIAEAVFGQKPSSVGGLTKFPLPAELANLLDLSRAGVEVPKDASEAIRLHPDLLSGIAPEKLLKLLKYKIYAEALVRSGKKKNDVEVLMGDVEKYTKFARKEAMTSPQIPHPHVLDNGMEGDLQTNGMRYTLTNLGICTTVNGNALKKTFADNKRVSAVGGMLDERKDGYKSIKIAGSGSMYETEFWLNARSGTDQGRTQGEMSIAINNWVDHFSVRGNRLIVRAGRNYNLKLYPTVHTASDGFKDIDLEKRRCRFQDEVPDNYTSGSMFNYYTKKACIFECILAKAVEKVRSRYTLLLPAAKP